MKIVVPSSTLLARRGDSIGEVLAFVFSWTSDTLQRAVILNSVGKVEVWSGEKLQAAVFARDPNDLWR